MPGDLNVRLRITGDARAGQAAARGAAEALGRVERAGANAARAARRQATGNEAANAEMRRGAALARKQAAAQDRAAASARRQAAANKQVSRSFFEAHGRLGAYAASLVGLHQLLRATGATVAAADAYTDLNNRLRLVTESEAGLVAVRQELLAISQDTRTALAANAQLYSRIALSADATGHSQAQLLRVTELLNKQVLIGGNNASEAAAGLVQFAQGLASGRLQGDELRSVMENLLGVQQGLIVGFRRLRQRGQIDFNVTRANIRELAAEGVLSAELLIEAILASGDDTERKFEQVAITIDGGLQRIRNTALQLAGDFDAAIDASDRIGAALDAVGQRLGEVDAKELAADLSALARLGQYVLGAALLRLTVGTARYAAQLVRTSAGARAFSRASRIGATRALRLAAAHVAGAAAARRHRVAIHRLGLSLNALRGGLALLGGPAGIALLAAYGIARFAASNRDAQDSLDGLPDDVYELRDALADLSRVELANAQSRLTAELTRMRQELADAQAEADRLDELFHVQARAGLDIRGVTQRQTQAQERVAQLQEQINALLAKETALRNQLVTLNRASAEATAQAVGSTGAASEARQAQEVEDVRRRSLSARERLLEQQKGDLATLDQESARLAAQIAGLDRRIASARRPRDGAGQSIGGAPTFDGDADALEAAKARIEEEQREIAGLREQIVVRTERELADLAAREQQAALRALGYQEVELYRSTAQATRETLKAGLDEQLRLREELVEKGLLTPEQALEDELALHANYFTELGNLRKREAEERERAEEERRQRRRDDEIREYADRLARAQGFADAATLIENRKNEAAILAKYQYNQEIGRIAALANRLSAQQGLAAVQTSLEIAKQGLGALAAHSKTAFRAYKAAAIAQTIISTYQAAQDSYAALAKIPYVGPALGIAAAAAAIAAGFARVQAIRAQRQPQGYARGGVVDSPTYFHARNVPYGVAGEAGPEAILPLRRGPGGRLGVGATGAMRPVTVTFNIAPGAIVVQGGDDPARAGREAADNLVQTLEKRMVRVLVDQQRPGGVLNRTEQVA